MTRDLGRLLAPRSIAVVGGGPWCASVIRECRRIGFSGPIWPVHPTRPEVGGLPAVARLADLPGVPDAAFVGVNRQASIGIVAELSAMGAGGAVCFASGFAESEAETGDGGQLQAALIAAAGGMPFLGPNCYGFLNALDGAALWPDQHGLVRIDSGVAILAQSSNIALNLTMQRRGLPIAYLVTAGNQAAVGIAGIGAALLRDPRVTALGLYVEGFGDVRSWEALAATARELGKSVVALKVGASEGARAATVSHSASLAGSDAGAGALMRRLGIGRVKSLSALVEALKVLHVTGPLSSNRIASMSCSGGEASVMADAAVGLDLCYPPLNQRQKAGLRAALGPKVALANPLDYNTYIWADREAMARCFAAMMDQELALGIVVLDFPRADRCSAADWDIVVDAVAEARAASGRPMAILASLPDTMPEATAVAIMDRGILPLAGITEALEALAVTANLGGAADLPVLLPGSPQSPRTLTEVEAKAALASFGVSVPRAGRAGSAAAAAATAQVLGFPVVLKGEGAAHKTEAGLVALNLASQGEVAARAKAMGCGSFLVEEMVAGGVAELIVGVVADPAHGFVLTLGAGGVLTEILRDSRSLILPVTAQDVETALEALRIAPLLAGYRGAPPADRAAIVRAVLAVQDYVTAHAGTLAEVEINPLICTPTGAVAADALIRKGEDR